MTPTPGSLVAEAYRLVALVGEGGMGSVWSATREDDGRSVALKLLKSNGVDGTRRLVREARIAQRLEHPNIVRVEEILAPTSTAPILVLELLEGESLRHRLERVGALSVSQAACVVATVARAIAFAHQSGVVHRDLKPENVYFHRGALRVPVLKVLDFGIAKVVNAGELHTAGMTQTGTMLGTPHYMAPEQVFGEGDVDGAADVWALGVVLYECLSGARPFEGDNFGQVFRAITMGAPRALAELLPDLTSELTALVHRMLASERESRPALAEVVAVLEAHADTAIEAVPSATRAPPSAGAAGSQIVDPLGETLAPTALPLHARIRTSPGEGGGASPAARGGRTLRPVVVGVLGAVATLALAVGVVGARARTAVVSASESPPRVPSSVRAVPTSAATIESRSFGEGQAERGVVGIREIASELSPTATLATPASALEKGALGGEEAHEDRLRSPRGSGTSGRQAGQGAGGQGSPPFGAPTAAVPWARPASSEAGGKRLPGGVHGESPY